MCLIDSAVFAYLQEVVVRLITRLCMLKYRGKLVCLTDSAVFAAYMQGRLVRSGRRSLCIVLITTWARSLCKTCWCVCVCTVCTCICVCACNMFGVKVCHQYLIVKHVDISACMSICLSEEHAQNMLVRMCWWPHKACWRVCAYVHT